MIDKIRFIQEHIPYNELGVSWTLRQYQRAVLGLFWAKDYAIRCWSEPKKSGKSHITECVLIEEAMTSPDTKIGIFANDSEQAESVIFKGCCDLIKKNPDLRSSAKILTKEIRFSNGSEIEWFAADYQGGAGHRRKVSAIDEPWAFSTERMRRLYEELLPPPTIPGAYLWLSTTAGFSGEGALLEEIFKRGIAGKRVSRKYEVYRDKGLCMFWSHTPRQPWQTKSYYSEQRRLLRPNSYIRQHENRFVAAESQFITAEMWDAIVDPNHTPILSGGAVHVAIDLGVKSDTSAIVAVCFDPSGKKLMVAFHKIWRPSKGKPVSLDDVKSYIREIRQQHKVQSISADPSQAYLAIQQLWSEDRIKVEEFVQSQSSGVKMGETLYGLVRDANLIAYKSAELREHVLNAVAADTGAGIRLVKGKATRKIDAAIALSMALVAAIAAGPVPTFNRDAVPMGIKGGIGREIGRAFGTTFGQSFGGDFDEDEPAEREIFRFGF
jgi:phage terminase large subunit-like protein